MSTDDSSAAVRGSGFSAGLGAMLASADGFAKFADAMKAAAPMMALRAAALMAKHMPPAAHVPARRSGRGLRKHARVRKAMQAWSLTNTISIPKWDEKPTAYWVGA